MTGRCSRSRTRSSASPTMPSCGDDPRFWNALLNTVVFTVATVPVQVIAGLLLAIAPVARWLVGGVPALGLLLPGDQLVRDDGDRLAFPACPPMSARPLHGCARSALPRSTGCTRTTWALPAIIMVGPVEEYRLHHGDPARRAAGRAREPQRGRGARWRDALAAFRQRHHPLDPPCAAVRQHHRGHRVAAGVRPGLCDDPRRAAVPHRDAGHLHVRAGLCRISLAAMRRPSPGCCSS